MKKTFTYFFCLIPLFIFCQKYKNPQGFIENKGQIIDQKGKENKDVKFLLNTNGLNVQLRETGFSYDVFETERIPVTTEDKSSFTSANPISDYKTNSPEYISKHTIHRIDIDFLNPNPNTRLITEQKSTHYTNYFNLKHKPEGITEVYNYQKVTYQNIYHNIDVAFFIPSDSTKVVEYNFIIKPGGKISDIQFKFKGAKNELVDNKIKMNLRFGLMEETIPMSWIELENSKSEIKINFKKIKKNVYGLDGDINSSNKTIIIDPVPVRLWGTYFGGTGYEMSGTLNVDSYNNVIISGGSGSLTNIASAGPNISGYESGGAFIAKFNTNGQFLWGSYYPFGTRVVLDNQDNMYLSGNVINANTFIPSAGCHQPVKDQYNSGYLMKLNNLGVKQWGTYYGGNGNDYVTSLTVDTNGNIYIVGETSSSNNFSTSGAFQMEKASPGSYSTGFIAKFDSNGARIWGTFYGGELADGFTECAISLDGFLYAIGSHNSITTTNLTTPGSYQPTSDQFGGMIVKFDLNGNRIWGTYIADKTHLFGARLKDNYMVLYGRGMNNYGLGTSGTMHENYIQPVPQGSTLSSYNSNFTIIKFNFQTQQYLWGTYFFEQIVSMDIDSLDNIYFAGSTGVNNGLTTPDAYMPVKTNYSKSYLIKLNATGQKIWGTYYGGNFAEQLGECKADQNNDIYLYGNTNGSTTGIATPGAHQTTLGSNPDTYLVKFRDCLSVTTINSNSPVCIGETLNLNAFGGTNYLWTGPNGFTSTDQNPVLTNTNASQSGEYTCMITGTNGCDDSRTINVLIGDPSNPVPTLQNLPNIIGDCHIVISTIPTASDNCSGLINATTTDPLYYSLPGDYTITWNFVNGNGNTATQTQNVTINVVPEPTLVTPQQFCIQENATLNNIIVTGQNIQWYDAMSAGNLLPNTTTLTDGTTYYATQTINGCESNCVPVTITIQNTPAPSGNSNQSFCYTSNATLENITLNATNSIWYDSINGTTVLPQTTMLLNGTTYYATQTLNDCESPTRFAVEITLINTLNATNHSESICDELNDGSETINLTNYNANLITSTGNTFNYYNSLAGATSQNASDLIQNPNNYNLTTGNNNIHVRIDSPNTCFQIVQLNLTLLAKPIVNILDTMPICEGSSININAGAGYDNYLWSTNQTTPSITVTQPGNYSVIVSENHGSLVCATTKNFTVVNSNIGTVSQIITSDWTNNENTVTVLLTAGSVGNYVYSLNGIDFQSSNTFNGLENGQHTVYIKDLNGCGIVDEDIYLLMYPVFFTPNGDSYNDTWKIKFSEIEPNLSIKIFDRYGKFIKQLGPNSAGWDGTYMGNNLPSSDYWFVVTRENGKEYRGHFSLRR